MLRNYFVQNLPFGKMQRGRSPSFELFQLDMNVCRKGTASYYTCTYYTEQKKKGILNLVLNYAFFI